MKNDFDIFLEATLNILRIEKSINSYEYRTYEAIEKLKKRIRLVTNYIKKKERG